MNFEEERQEHKEPVAITISTKVPSKWRFHDLETDEVYRFDESRHLLVMSEDVLTLRDVERILDDLNGERGNLCLYCDANTFNGQGIIHNETCIILRLRRLIHRAQQACRAAPLQELRKIITVQERMDM